MPSGAGKPGPHTAVKQELLVRYLDYWVPAALHSSRAATYLDRSGYGPEAAVRVIAEFADLLAGRELTILIEGEVPADPGVAGLRLAAVPDDPAAAVRATGRAPVFAYLDGAVPDELLAAVGGARDGEALLVTGPATGDPRAALYAAGFGYVAAVELVDDAGTAQLLRFATSATRSLERFKDALWAVDEYAGIRYRDPTEPDAIPLDISYEPHPGPLRRAVLAHLAAGEGQTVTQLREFALARTLYRSADINRALAPLLARGALVREPERGRITGATLVRLAGAAQ
jgi:hypothetical protein